ncbi:hypothetical protein [Kamptonema formosum]|uniref:hypothetical protein n=1 Tax=Kamptonema formosum TaxID=331992 RepID=UPI00034B3FF3|nr:hypothetical protein [Kamptonema formosum]
MVLEIAAGTYATAFVRGEANLKWLGEISSQAVNWMKNAGKDILAHLEKVKGGAIEVWNAISSGNWDLFKSWWNGASTVEKGAGVLLAGTIIYVGGSAIGGIARGIGAVLTRIVSAATGAAARVGPGGRAFLGGTLAMTAPQLMSTVVQTSEKLWHFDWAQSDKSLMNGIKNAIEGLYTPLGQALGRSVASVIVGASVKNVPKVRINIRQLANLIEIHDGNESVRNSLLEAVANIWQAVKSAGKKILFNMTYMNVRKFVAKGLGKENDPGWGKESPNFTFAYNEKWEETVKTVFPNEKLAEVVIESFEEFFDTIGELLTEEDVIAEFI